MMATPTQKPDPVRGQLIEAAIGLLATDGTESLALRRVASAAHVSTMCVYSRFGDKFGLMNAVYAGGFERLSDEMSAAAGATDPVQRLVDLGVAYRRFALSNPSLYSLMFEKVGGFDPSPDLRSTTPGRALGPILEAMTEAVAQAAIEAESPAAAAHTFWSAAHGSVSLEMTLATASPFGAAGDSEEVYRSMLETTLRGLAPAAPRTVGS
jgi:AcrR family transcriptional regulator